MVIATIRLTPTPPYYYWLLKIRYWTILKRKKHGVMMEWVLCDGCCSRLAAAFLSRLTAAWKRDSRQGMRSCTRYIFIIAIDMSEVIIKSSQPKGIKVNTWRRKKTSDKGWDPALQDISTNQRSSLKALNK